MPKVVMYSPSKWQLRQEIYKLRDRVRALEDQITALKGVAIEVVDTDAFAENMAFSFANWMRVTLVPMAQEALGMEEE